MSDKHQADRVALFTEGDELYDDMIRAINAAQSSIALESYIFAPDAVGLQFIEALSRRARTGIPVQVHLDAFGSFALARSEQAARMREAGIQLKWFNPLRWYKPFRFNRRNHRKLLIIDDRSVWLGGFNIHRENSLREYGQERWHDTHIRIDGPQAGKARVYFDQLWQGRRDWSPAYNRDADSMLVSNQNWLQRHQLRRMLSIRFFQARRRIWMCTPYFMPDHFLQQQMIKAARRGMDVRLLLPYESDRPLTQLVARAAYASLIASGIRIYEYEPRFLHTKIIIIDDDWCTLGSSNLDYRSFFINYEINLVSTRSDLVAQLQRNMIADLDRSIHINPVQGGVQGWRAWVYQQMGSLLRRIL
jgi:cardiolipin synthase A/B